MSVSPGSISRWRAGWGWLLGAGLAVFALGLGVLIYTGNTARYIQDDYCFSVILARRNLVDIYLNETTFSGNRFMLVLVTLLSERLGAWSVPVLPGALVATWWLGLTLALRQEMGWLLARKSARGGAEAAEENPTGFSSANSASLREVSGLASGWPWLLSALAAAGLVFLTLYTATNRIQILYWRAGSLTYLAPLALFPYLLALAFWQIRRGRMNWLSGLLTGLLALGVAGFCETAAVAQMGLLLIFSAALAGLRWGWRRRVGTAAWVALATWGGTLAAVALLLSSPANAPRFAGSYHVTPDLWGAWLGALRGTLLFFKLVVYFHPLTGIFIVLFAAAVAYGWAALRGGEPYSIRQIAVWGTAWLGGAYLWVAAAMFPSFYIEASFPSGRAQLIARWIVYLALVGLGTALGLALRWAAVRPRWAGLPLVAGVGGALGLLFLVGLPHASQPEPTYREILTFLGAQVGIVPAALLGATLLAGFLARWSRGRETRRAGVLLVCAGLLLAQPLAALGSVSADFAPLAKRAALWDWRDAQIRQLSLTEKNVTVQALDSLDGITELQVDPQNWVNRCAAWYYQIDSLRAVEPILKFPKN